MKYELVSRSVTIKGKVFRKSENIILDDEKFGKVLLDSLYQAGFIKPKGTKAQNPTETIDQYHSELGKLEAKAKKEAEEKAKKEAEELEAKAKKEAEEKAKKEAEAKKTK